MAANPLRGEAELVAGDRTLTLCLDVNAFCYAEDELGKTTDQIVVTLESRPADMMMARGLIWAALQRHHPGTNLLEAGEIISESGLAEARAALTKCLEAAFGTVEGKDKPRPPRKRAGNGAG